jgi:hypothetical protein
LYRSAKGRNHLPWHENCRFLNRLAVIGVLKLSSSARCGESASSKDQNAVTDRVCIEKYNTVWSDDPDCLGTSTHSPDVRYLVRLGTIRTGSRSVNLIANPKPKVKSLNRVW